MTTFLFLMVAVSMFQFVLINIYMPNAGHAEMGLSKLALPRAGRLSKQGSILRSTAVQELEHVSTKFYIYNDVSISLSLIVNFLRRQGKAALVTNLDHVMSDMQAEYETLKALERHPLRTMNPDDATIYVIPTPITELIAYGCRWETCIWYDQAFRALSEHAIFRKTQGHNHVIISYGWYSFNKRYVAFVPALSRNYRQLENVTVASHYDPFGSLELAEKTKFSKEKDFHSLFPREPPLTKSFSIGLGINDPFPLQRPTYEKFQLSKYFFFYHSRNTEEEPFGHGSTKYRQIPLEESVIASLPLSSIGNDLDSEEWAHDFVSSSFCLVIRGDTPHSHSLMYAVRAGCIPVVVSDYYQEYAGPFKSFLSMADFCIFIQETKFLNDPVKELVNLQDLSEEFVQEKLSNLTIAQSIVLPDHPQSLFVEAFLKEAVAANKKLVPEVAARVPVKMGETEVFLSGSKLRYRYPTNFGSNSNNKNNGPVLVVGVLSSARKPDGRLAIRNTWAEDHPNQVIFLVSGSWESIKQEFYDYGDLLWVDMPEDYNLLTYKTQAFLHATEAHVDTYDYVMKTDDDSYVGIDEVTRILEKFSGDYWGYCMLDEQHRVASRDTSYYWYTSEEVYRNEQYPVWAQGLGYVLSRKFNQCAVAKLAQMDFMPWEDVATGILAEQCGVTCQRDEWEYWKDDHPTGFRTVEHHIKNRGDMLWVHWDEMEKKKRGEWVEAPKTSSEAAVSSARKQRLEWTLDRQETFDYLASLSSSASDFISTEEIRVEQGDYIYAHPWDSPIVVEKYKLIFFATPKIASTVFQQLFRRMMDAEDWKDSGWNVYDPKLNGLVTLRDFTPRDASAMMNSEEWTRAIFVRDPSERLLSAFLDKAKGTFFDRGPSKFDGVVGGYVWKFCCHHDDSKQCVQDAQTLQGFVELVETKCHDVHWNPQTYRMEPKFWSAVNFVGGLENVYNDTKRLLEHIGAWDVYGKTGWGKNAKEAIFETRSGVQHARNAKDRYENYFTPELEKRVKKMYAIDYINPVLPFDENSNHRVAALSSRGSTPDLTNERSAKKAAPPPLVMVTRECSRSTFLTSFAWRLVGSHTGKSAHVGELKGINDAYGGEYLATIDKPNSRFNYTLSKTDKFRADKEMVLRTHKIIAIDAQYVMAPKVMANPQLTDGVGAGLRELGARVVMTYRRNKLEWMICKIKDCFWPKESGASVFENGTRSDLCFDRRTHPEVKTLAHLNVTYFDQDMRGNMKRWGCSQGLEDPAAKVRIEQTMGLKPDEYPQLAEESLIAFELEQEGSPAFIKSMSDWKKFLRGWGIEPNETLILEEMRKQGIGTRPRSSAKRSLYNYGDVQAIVRGWAKSNDPKVCDWSWMAT